MTMEVSTTLASRWLNAPHRNSPIELLQSQTMKIDVKWLGRQAYAEAWALQKELIVQVGNGVLPSQLLLLEHPPTYTFGRRADKANLLYSSAELRAEQIETFDVDRGGDVTYHGPGQLVGYPILNLRTLQGREQPDLHYYLRQIEQVLIDTLAQFQVRGWRYEGYTGVWVDQFPADASPLSLPTPHKIAAIGIKVSGNGVSSHGFALNVATNLDHFRGIIPCGIAEYDVTSLSHLLRQPILVEQVLPVLTDAFLNCF